MSRVASRQPQQPALNWASPLLSGVSAIWTPSFPAINLVNGVAMTQTATAPTLSPRASGIGQITAATTGPAVGYAFPNSDAIFDNTNCTIAVFRRSQDTGLTRVNHAFGYAVLTIRVLAHIPFTDGNIYWDFGNSGSGRISTAFTKSTEPEAFVFTAGGGVGREIWRNGIRIANGASGTTRTPDTSPFGISYTNSETEQDAADNYLIVISRRVWSAAEIASWSANPWQIFRAAPARAAAAYLPGSPTTRSVPLFSGGPFSAGPVGNYVGPQPAAGGRTVVAADTVTFTDSAVSVTNRLAVAVDTVVFTDSAVSVTNRLAVATDTVAFTDSAVSGVANTVVATDSVSFTDSAVAVSILAAVAVDTLTFSDSAVSITNRIADATDSVTFTDSGVATRGGAGRSVAATDSVTFSDSAVSITTRLAVAVDSISFTDSAVSTSDRLAAAADSVTFSDTAVSVTNRLAVGVDSLTFSDSGVSVTNRLATATDTVSFSDSGVAVKAAAPRAVIASDTVVFTDFAVCLRGPPVNFRQFQGNLGFGIEEKLRNQRKLRKELEDAFSEEVAAILPEAEAPATVKAIGERTLARVRKADNLPQIAAELKAALAEIREDERRLRRRRQDEELLLF